MEERIVKFITALRAAGVRVSVAESQDAWRAVERLGVADRGTFRLSLRSTLVKDADALPTFDELFPLYFGSATPPLTNPQGGLSPEDQQMLRDALERMMQDLARQLQQLLEWLLSGRGPTEDDLQQLADQAGADPHGRLTPSSARRMAQRMQDLLGWDQLQDLLDQLWEALAQAGMDPASIEQLQEQVAENAERLAEQLGDFAGQQVRDQRVDQARRRPMQDLLDRPLDSLSHADMDALREQVRRLAARLRSRAALRQKRGKQGKLDPKATLRRNLRYQGVPFEMRFRQRRLKPKLVVILDVSTSMRPVVEFFLRLLYELQDQVQKTRSFAFVDHLEDVTADLQTRHLDQAITVVLTKLPAGHYNTDLGRSLRQLEAEHLGALDGRTTLIVLGDGRNNYNDPALDTFGRLGRRARRVIWLNPEYPAQWGSGDSDMLSYAPLCSAVYQTRSLSQLAEAVDRILG
ncbi:MAG TPA: VWA domain-containing protein [Aggregatilineaceae bacterium]|mgnify:CR=1 FL=1|nr:VWA domain-containing protein [Aggregatilineaceae bacterium]